MINPTIAVALITGTFSLTQIVVTYLLNNKNAKKEDLIEIMKKDEYERYKTYLVDYLAEVAKRFDGDIIVCGHSKGGYVAQYAVLNSPKEVRDRIKYLYNNDGPGFKNYDYLGSDVYNELLPRYRHFIPQSSFIGMMLMHDDDYTVVKSNGLIGPLQHDLRTWQFKGDKLITCDDVSAVGKVTDLVFHDLIRSLSEE